MMHHPDQYVLDFSSRANDRCATLLGLRSARLPIDITRGRVEGVIELLQRLVLLSKYLPESIGDAFECDVQVMAIAARIERRKSVSEKTVRRWTADAKMLGLLSVEYASQHYGGCRWNSYTVHFGRVLRLIAGDAPEWPEAAGHGRTRPDIVSAPGAVMMSDPGADTMSDPNSVFPNVSQKHSPPLRTPSESTRGTFATAPDEQPVVVSDFQEGFSEPLPRSSEHSSGVTPASAPDELELARELETLGMSEDGARGAVVRAKARGLTHAQVHELVERYRVEAARDPHMTVGWLYRWLTGQSRPAAKPRASPVPACGGRGDGWSKEQMQREKLRAKIIRNGRAAGAPEELIRERLIAAGVE